MGNVRMAKPAKPSVLIVEDDRHLRELYRAALRSAGYEVGAVEDGADALWRVGEWIPDAIVLDLGLPRLDGRELHLELRSRRETRSIPIVIVTGLDAADLDFNQFAAILRKPVDMDVLIGAVNEAVRGAQLSLEPASIR
jgi:DNA-binding response OmpR family regulator